MKQIIILSVILFIIILVPCFSQDWDINTVQEIQQLESGDDDTGLFDIPDDIDTNTGDSNSFTEETFSLYGYLVNFFAIDFIFSGDEFDTSYLGNVSYLRLKGDWKPHDNLTFHAEISYDAKLGNQNPYMLYEQYGMLTPNYQAGFPQEDFIQTFVFDHFYGKLNFWKFDLQFGKMPIAWGTGYAFNPTQKVSLLPFMDTVAEETPGTYGIVPSFSIIPGLSLEGYLAFQDKSHKTTSVPGDGEWENLPYGIKLFGIIGSFDLSVSWIKEVLYTASPTLPGEYEHISSYYIGADCAGGIRDIGVYGEAAFHLPQNEDKEFDFEGQEINDLVELSCGFFYTIPVLEVDVRGEYYHQGIGVTDKDEYNIMDVFSGEKILQGEDYLFVYLDKTFLNYYRISAGSFINLHDGSWALFPVISYDMYDNFNVELGSTLFFGEQGSEFYGEYDLSMLGLGIIDIIQPLVYMKCKLSF